MKKLILALAFLSVCVIAPKASASCRHRDYRPSYGYGYYQPYYVPAYSNYGYRPAYTDYGYYRPYSHRRHHRTHISFSFGF